MFEVLSNSLPNCRRSQRLATMLIKAGKAMLITKQIASADIKLIPKFVQKFQL